MTQEHAKVIIVGSGFSGLAMAIRLKQHGINDFVILERADEVGGTWHYNTYPGCMCDVPSHLYSLSFAPNPNWSRTYSPQAEIREYLRRCADQFGIRPHLRTNVEVRSSSWQAQDEQWEVDTSAGTFTATVLVSGAGPLTEPLVPDLPGLERFQGKTMHSARWDHDYPLRGKRVASIGTGASAIQYVPEIQPEVEQLHVFQRTPPWVMPHGDRAITEAERALYRRFPPAQQLVRAGVYASREVLLFGFAKDPRLMEVLEKLARAHMRRQIAEPELRAKVTPNYTLGCKRILPSNRWYPALTEPNVELVTAGIKEIREHAVVDGSGVEREVDAIVFGTGFHVTDISVGQPIHGRVVPSLSELVQCRPLVSLGSAAPGFPPPTRCSSIARAFTARRAISAGFGSGTVGRLASNVSANRIISVSASASLNFFARIPWRRLSGPPSITSSRLASAVLRRAAGVPRPAGGAAGIRFPASKSSARAVAPA